MAKVYNSGKTADTVNRAIDNSMGTTTTTQGAAAAGKIITEDLQPVVQCTGGYMNPFIVKTISGVPPVEFHAVERALKSWSIYGNTVEGVSVGRKTDNMYNTAETEWYEGGTKDSQGNVVSSTISHFTNNYTPVSASTEYYLAGNLGASGNAHRIYYYAADKSWISRSDSLAYNVHTFTTPANCAYIQVQVVNSVSTTADWMLVTGSTEPTEYEPYGVEIPIECAGITYNAYIADFLRKSTPVERKRKSKKAVNDTTVYDIMDSTGTVTRNVDTDGTPLETPTTETYTAPIISTIWGYNEFDVNTTVTPSNVTVQYYDN